MMKQKVSLAERLNIGSEVRELKLGYTFNSKNTTNAFHTIKYDFKPASVDRNRVATVDVGSNNQITVTVPNLESSGVPHTIYKGNQKKYTKECILIFDKKTGDITLEKLNHNIQVKKTRSEMTNKANLSSSPMSSGSINKLENSTMRITSKTKVSTGNRRNTIIELKSRNSPLQRSPSSLSNCSKSPQAAAPAWNANNGQSTLPSIPMIVDDDVDEIISCNNNNNNNMNTAAVDTVDMMNTNYLANTSSTSSSTSSHNSIQYDTVNQLQQQQQQQLQQQENHQLSTTNINKPNTPNKYRNGNNGKTSNLDSHMIHKRAIQKLDPLLQHEQDLQNQQQQVQQWQQQLQEQQRLQQQQQQQQQKKKEQEEEQQLKQRFSSNNSKKNGVSDFTLNYQQQQQQQQQHHYSDDIASSPTLASEAAALEMNIANTLSSSSSSSDSESSGSDSGTESDDSFEEDEETATNTNRPQHNPNELNELPNLSLGTSPASSPNPNQYDNKAYKSSNIQQNNQHSNTNYLTSNGSNFPNDLLHSDLQLSSNSSDDDSD